MINLMTTIMQLHLGSVFRGVRLIPIFDDDSDAVGSTIISYNKIIKIIHHHYIPLLSIIEMRSLTPP
jgi:hypothetical protein